MQVSVPMAMGLMLAVGRSLIEELSYDIRDIIMNKIFMDEKEAADYLCVSQRTLQRLRANNTGPNFLRVGGKRIVYRESEIESWLANHNQTKIQENISSHKEHV
jgi:predicted DNA-binding transcriptional regulator AlpA